MKRKVQQVSDEEQDTNFDCSPGRSSRMCGSLVARRQYELTKAGAWSYDIKTQEKQAEALDRAYSSSAALLAKYVLRAPRDAVVMAISVTPESFVSNLGAYETYTQGATPVIVLGSPQAYLSVRCYVDEFWCRDSPLPRT